MFEAVKFYPKPPRTYELFLAPRAPVKFTPGDFFHADGGTASRALLPRGAYTHSLRDQATPQFQGYRDDPAARWYDSAHTHTNGEQMLIIVPQAAQLIIAECLPGAVTGQFSGGTAIRHEKYCPRPR